jgi:hypothetical protein
MYPGDLDFTRAFSESPEVVLASVCGFDPSEDGIIMDKCMHLLKTLET